MITINLLPVRAARKKENIRRQVSIFFLCIVFGLCVMVYLTLSMSHKISAITEEIEEAQAELKQYEDKAKQVKKIKAELKKLEDKMDIIVKLEADRTGPVRFMDALTSFVTPEKIWLTSLSETQGRLNLIGVAADNKVVADFMTSLEGSPLFKNVDLVSSKQVDMKEGRKFKEFSITCNLVAGAPQDKPKKS
jgi:type IV pilus assembly protein PilN